MRQVRNLDNILIQDSIFEKKRNSIKHYLLDFQENKCKKAQTNGKIFSPKNYYLT